MEQTILTTHQSAVVEQIQNEPEITTSFYLTGGTALTAFYLRHRESEDLDFFTESDISPRFLRNFFVRHRESLGIDHIDDTEHTGMIFFFLTFRDKTKLKVDFVNFPYPQLETGTRLGHLKIDSIFDIALNKLYTLSDNPRARDYVDLYCILRTQDISLDQVYRRMDEKFHPFTFDDAISLEVKLTRVVDVKEFPTMLIPFDKNKMIDFFLSEARKLTPKIFK